MSESIALLWGALACWAATPIVIRIGWDATFGGPLWVSQTCLVLAMALLAATLTLFAFGLYGLWGAYAPPF